MSTARTESHHSTGRKAEHALIKNLGQSVGAGHINNNLSIVLHRLQNRQKSEAIENAIKNLSQHEKLYAEEPDSYELNKAIGIFLAYDPDTMEFAETFLIKAANENRDEPARQQILENLAKVFELAGDIERENLFLQIAGQNSANLFKNLGHSYLRLGKEQDASDIFNNFLDFHYDFAKKKALERGSEITQLLYPADVTCSRFGELAHNLDLYIKARKLGLTPKVKAILIAHSAWVSNQVLLDYWREQHPDEISIISDEPEIARAKEAHEGWELSMEIFRLPDGRALHTHQATPEIWRLWEDAGNGPLLKLRGDHRQKGFDWMRDHGAPEDAWFAALHVREQGYHNETGWAYNRHRDSRLDDYFPAIKAITDQGGWVVRLGDPSMTPLPPMEHVIDYTVATDRAEELDLFFCAEAKLLVGASSGCISVADVFGTPVLAVNMFPPGDAPWSQRDFYIHQRLQRRTTGEYLNAREMVAPPGRMMQSPRYFEDQDLAVIANSAEDICAAVEEMMARLDGKFRITENDKADVRRYRELNDYPGIRTQSVPATTFLRRYRHLTD